MKYNKRKHKNGEFSANGFSDPVSEKTDSDGNPEGVSETSGPEETAAAGSEASCPGNSAENISEKTDPENSSETEPENADPESSSEAGKKDPSETGSEGSGKEEASEQCPESADDKIAGNAQEAADASSCADASETSSETGLEDEKEPDTRHGRKKLKIVIICAAAAAVVILAAVYVGVGYYYTTRYFPNTTINDIDVSKMTIEEVKESLSEEVDTYELLIEERGDASESLTGSQVGLTVSFDETLDNLMEDQKSFAWPGKLKDEKNYETEILLSVDEAALSETVSALSCADEENMTVSADAEIYYSEETDAYEIQDAVWGTYIDTEALTDLIEESVLSLAESVDLEDAGLYTDPVYTEDSEEVISACEEINARLDTVITYDMEDAGTITISRDEIRSWLSIDEEFNVVFVEDEIAAYVSEFADTYDTQGTTHTLATSYGATVSVSAGNYGWKLDQSAEIAALEEDLLAKEDVTREPNYSSTAASHLSNDYGSTYVEINLTAQHLYFYKDGVLIVESDLVSGCVANGTETPTGIYKLTYKATDATLRGDDYETPVSYWMPFNGGVGMHDATWRSSFGGTIYKTNGSHGCINLPYSVAETIYNNISAGDPIIVYTLEGTESTEDEEEEEETEEETSSEEETTSSETTSSTTAAEN